MLETPRGTIEDAPSLFDQVIGRKAPTTAYAKTGRNGEGSSFMSIPVKRNHLPSDPSSIPLLKRKKNRTLFSSIPLGNETYFDFKHCLLPHIVVAAAPPSSRAQIEQVVMAPSRRASEVASMPENSPNGQEDRKKGLLELQDILSSPLVPQDHHWYALNQLRIHAGAPERTEQGVEKLMNYYAQLCWLEERFPYDLEKVGFDDLCVVFHHCNRLMLHSVGTKPSVLKSKVLSTQSKLHFYEIFLVVTDCIQYEKAAVMWNLGAVYSQLGAIQGLWMQDGLKIATQYFQVGSNSISKFK
jgi:hypothetical protein